DLHGTAMELPLSRRFRACYSSTAASFRAPSFKSGAAESGRGVAESRGENVIMRTLQTLAKQSCTAALVAAAPGGAVGCGGGGDNTPYKPQPAWSGKAGSVPAPPSLPSTPIKNGDAFTVYGAVHQLRSLMHNKDVTQPPAITITGYIVDSNIPRAPDCAVHK